MSEPPLSDRPIPGTETTVSRRLPIVLYATAAFLFWVSLYLYMPTLPVYIQQKSGNLALVGIVLAMYGLWQAVIRLPLGITTDWFGRRKPFIILGFAFSALGAITLATADSVYGLLLGRAITGLAAGTWVPLIVIFSSLFPPQEVVRASAILTFTGSVGRMLATSLTGTLNNLGGYSLAFFGAAGTAVLAILAILPARETRRPRHQPTARHIGQLITRPDVLLPGILNGISQHAVWTTTYGFLPVLAKHLGASDIMQSLLMSTSIGVILLGNFLAAVIVSRLGPHRMVYLGFILMSIGIGIAAWVPSLGFLFGAQFLIGLAQGAIYPVLMGMSIQQVSDHERATAMGLHQAVYAIGMFSGPALSGFLADLLGLRPMLGLTALGCLLLGVAGVRRLVLAHQALSQPAISSKE